jgi:hypothetical protein
VPGNVRKMSHTHSAYTALVTTAVSPAPPSSQSPIRVSLKESGVLVSRS